MDCRNTGARHWPTARCRSRFGGCGCEWLGSITSPQVVLQIPLSFHLRLFDHLWLRSSPRTSSTWMKGSASKSRCCVLRMLSRVEACLLPVPRASWDRRRCMQGRARFHSSRAVKHVRASVYESRETSTAGDLDRSLFGKLHDCAQKTSKTLRRETDSSESLDRSCVRRAPGKLCEKELDLQLVVRETQWLRSRCLTAGRLVGWPPPRPSFLWEVWSHRTGQQAAVC